MEKRTDAITVLVVDDEKDIRDASERILNRAGFKVLTAPRGDAGLEAAKNNRVSIVLLDLKMPGMDGMEVLGHIKAFDPEILVIVITGYATVETAIAAMKQGAYDFIPKPFEPDQLRIVVNRASEKIRLKTEAEKLELERRRTLADLDTEKSRIRSIIESLPDGVLVTNPSGTVVLLNPALRHLLGLATDAAPGKPIEDYIPDVSLCKLIRAISRGDHIDFDDIPDHEFAMSEEKYLLAKAQPVLGEKNECLGSVVNFGDISDLKMLDRLKSEFVAKVSHELRSPLSTIHEQLAMVIRDMVNVAPQQDQYILNRAKEKTQGMISLIGDLLDLSRIEEGLICNEPKPVDPQAVLTGVIDFLKCRAEGKKQVLSLDLPDEPLAFLTVDPIALESIFGNLITNAINYTPEGGRINVTAEQVGINIRIKFADTGLGIAEKYQDRIFDRFYRVKDEKTRYITGTGLGLPIVKGLVTAMGGFIDVESAPGKGSTFTVLLPTSSSA